MDRAAANPTRRNLLIAAAGTAVCAILAAPMLRPVVGERTRRLLASNPLTRQLVPLATGEQTEWAAQVGTVFTAAGGNRLRLIGVEPLNSSGERPAGLRRHAFLAVFDVAGRVAMAGQRTHALTHPQYGAMELFLSPSDRPTRMYAVFN